MTSDNAWRQGRKLEEEGMRIYVRLAAMMRKRGLKPPALTSPTDTKLHRAMLAQINVHDRSAKTKRR